MSGGEALWGSLSVLLLVLAAMTLGYGVLELIERIRKWRR